MANLKYYSDEMKVYGDSRRSYVLDSAQAGYYFLRLRSHYKLKGCDITFKNWKNDKGKYRHRKHFLGDYGTIYLSLTPSIFTLAHEFAHAIDHKKRPDAKRRHCKAHARLTKRVYDYILKNKVAWDEVLAKKDLRVQERFKRKEEKKIEKEAYLASDQSKIDKLLDRKKRLESRIKRSENALKKIKKKLKYYEKKVLSNKGLETSSS